MDFIIKTVGLRDLATLVIATEQADVLRVAQLEAEEVLESLHRVVAAVDEVADEDVACVGHLATHAEKF